MLTPRTQAIVLAAAVLVWTSAPALAGPPGGRGPGGPPAGRGHPAAAKGDVKGDQDREVDEIDKKDAKDKTTPGKKQADKTHTKESGNKGG